MSSPSHLHWDIAQQAENQCKMRFSFQLLLLLLLVEDLIEKGQIMGEVCHLLSMKPISGSWFIALKKVWRWKRQFMRQSYTLDMNSMQTCNSVTFYLILFHRPNHIWSNALPANIRK